MRTNSGSANHKTRVVSVARAPTHACAASSFFFSFSGAPGPPAPPLYHAAARDHSTSFFFFGLISRSENWRNPFESSLGWGASFDFPAAPPGRIINFLVLRGAGTRYLFFFLFFQALVKCPRAYWFVRWRGLAVASKSSGNVAAARTVCRPDARTHALSSGRSRRRKRSAHDQSCTIASVVCEWHGKFKHRDTSFFFEAWSFQLFTKFIDNGKSCQFSLASHCQGNWIKFKYQKNYFVLFLTSVLENTVSIISSSRNSWATGWKEPIDRTLT